MSTATASASQTAAATEVADIPLSDQQYAFFDAFGYIHLRGLLADRIGDIITSFDEVWQQSGGGHHGRRHNHRERSCTIQFIDRHPLLSSLLDDPRIHGLATRILGDDFNYMGSDGNYYTGETLWHSDGVWMPDLRHIKIAFYLDPLTAETGTIRVIPGSHRFGDRFSDDLNRQVFGHQPFGIHPSEIPCQAPTLRPGDVVVFDHKTKHASFGGGSNRRMFTINLCQRYPEEKVPELRDYIGTMDRFWIDRAIGQVMIDTAGPRRMRHLEQVLANDGHLAERSRKHRESHAEPSRG